METIEINQKLFALAQESKAARNEILANTEPDEEKDTKINLALSGYKEAIQALLDSLPKDALTETTMNAVAATSQQKVAIQVCCSWQEAQYLKELHLVLPDSFSFSIAAGITKAIQKELSIGPVSRLYFFVNILLNCRENLRSRACKS